MILGLFIQRFTLADTLLALQGGFTADMATWMNDVPAGVRTLVKRGGLYSMREAIFVAFLVFFSHEPNELETKATALPRS